MIFAGRYVARPVSVGLVDPNGDGKAKMMIEFELVRTGQTILWYGALNSSPPRGSNVSALEITVEALRALGWKGNDLSSVDFPEDAEATIIVAHETWKGRTREKVVGVYRPALESMAAPQDVAREIAAQLAGTVAGITGDRRRNGGGRGPVADPGGGFDDDDAPNYQGGV